MADDPRRTTRPIPVLVGDNFEHIMAKAYILQTPSRVVIQITSDGENGQFLAGFLEQSEPIALSFIAIPVQNFREKREKKT